MPRRDLIVGTIVVATIVCLLSLVLASTIRDEYRLQLLKPLVAPEASFGLAAFLLIFSLLSVVVGALFAAGNRRSFGNSINRFSVQATMPAYFVFALIPLVSGLMLGIATGNVNGQCLLSCLSLPATIILAFVGIRSLSKQIS